MKNKSVWVIIVSVLVILGCGGYLFMKHQQANSNNMTSDTKDDSSIVITKKKTKSTSDESSNSSSNTDSEEDSTDSKYSTDEWMLMGYMAYSYDNYVQARHVNGDKEMVKTVRSDLSDGTLKAKRIGDKTYHLTNKFGSVDVTVEGDDVKVSGDGSTFTGFKELDETYGPYISEIKMMTKNIE